jgi:hypothetical protein
MRLYRYVGPPALLAAAPTYPAGTWIADPTGLERWLAGRTVAELREPFTYVVDRDKDLLLAPRRTEHVACAGGERVRGAGELTLAHRSDGWYVAAISNQSTGYCPDVASWPAVAVALDRAGLPHPGRFTEEITFRRCPACAEVTIVKDGDFSCAFCAADLPAEWNVDTDPPAGDGELLAWSVVANVAAEVARGEGGLDIRRGLKHFAGGAKVWVVPPQWGDGGERILVVGRHRASKKYLAVIVQARFLTNFRIRGVYSPTVYRLLTESPRTGRSALWPDLSTAESFCERWNRPRLRAVLTDGPYLATVEDPPPLDLLVDGERFYLAHFNANRAVYTREPPPPEVT